MSDKPDVSEVETFDKGKVKDAEKEKLIAAFQVFDKDNSGFIEIDELKEVMKKLGEDFTSEELELIIADAGEDGKISFDGKYIKI